ncbi:STAS domain-containing protein [Streptomyces sp. NPDC050388]|uniref:STAS domain-containing protein n=1 Tax=Streptomyces sp. NPDC050388 TaxID=3155781 RepID=UPI003428860F
MPGRLTVVSTSIDGIRVLTVVGDIDHDTAGPLRQALDPSRLGSVPCAVVDLGRVPFMDSTGINILITARQALTQAGGWLRLAGVQDTVMRTLRLVQLDTVIDCYPTLRQALHP